MNTPLSRRGAITKLFACVGICFVPRSIRQLEPLVRRQQADIVELTGKSLTEMKSMSRNEMLKELNTNHSNRMFPTINRSRPTHREVLGDFIDNPIYRQKRRHRDRYRKHV
jgi:hypothetical protein